MSVRLRSAGVLRLLCWPLVALFPIWILWLAVQQAAWTPEPFHWRQLMGEPPVNLQTEALLVAQPGPHFVVPRVLYTALLALPGLDVGNLVPLCWLFALLVLAGLLWLWRLQHEREQPLRLRPEWLLIVVLLAFSPALGATWLIDSRLFLFLPPLFLVAGLLLLTSGRRFRLRLGCAALLSALAIFSGPSGVLVWVVLAPLVFLESRRRGLSGGAPQLVSWCLVGNLGTLFCYRDFHSQREGVPLGLVGHLLEQPLAATRFLLSAVFPFGSSAGPSLQVWVGAVWLAGRGAVRSGQRRRARRSDVRSGCARRLGSRVCCFHLALAGWSGLRLHDSRTGFDPAAGRVAAAAPAGILGARLVFGTNSPAAST